MKVTASLRPTGRSERAPGDKQPLKCTPDSYIQSFREDACTDCAYRMTGSCPCPISYLLPLAVEAIESVDERRKAASLMN